MLPYIAYMDPMGMFIGYHNVKLIQRGIVEYTWTHELDISQALSRRLQSVYFFDVTFGMSSQQFVVVVFSFIRFRSKSVACCTQLWPFISYNWIIHIIHSINGVLLVLITGKGPKLLHMP